MMVYVRTYNVFGTAEIINPEPLGTVIQGSHILLKPTKKLIKQIFIVIYVVIFKFISVDFIYLCRKMFMQQIFDKKVMTQSVD